MSASQDPQSLQVQAALDFTRLLAVPLREALPTDAEQLAIQASDLASRSQAICLYDQSNSSEHFHLALAETLPAAWRIKPRCSGCERGTGIAEPRPRPPHSVLRRSAVAIQTEPPDQCEKVAGFGQGR